MNSYIHGKRHGAWKRAFLALALSLCCAAVLPGCGSTAAPAGGSAALPAQASSDQVQQSQSGQPVGGTLDAAQKTLSLEGYGAVGALTDQDLTVGDMLAYAAQDEYLARGEYAAIMQKFGTSNPYSNIKDAEETHLSLLKEIYSAYGLDFPEDTSADHIVVPEDLLQAAKTGVQAEIDNIAMYELFLTYDLPEDVKEVFTTLKDASGNHLLAFQKQVDKLS